MTYYFIVDTTTSYSPRIVNYPVAGSTEKGVCPMKFETEEEAVNYANAKVGSYEILKIQSEL